MEEKVKERLAALKAEFEKGQQKLQQLEDEAQKLRSTLLRISGAVQVMEELLQPETA